MDLIDRYLHAVRAFLPVSSQDDIIRELADDIRAQAADRQDELGRPLTPDDEATLLKKFGPPMVLAAKYRPAQHLISPVVFPFYWLTLKIALAGALAVQLATSIALVASGTPGQQVIGSLAAFPFTGLVTVFGWITLVFAVIDLNVRHLTSRATHAWDPRSLKEPKPLPRNSRVSLAFEIVFSTVFLGWWLALPSYPFLALGPAAAFVALGPAWRLLHLPIALIWLVNLVVLWTLLFRPDLATLRRAFNVGANAVGMVLAVVLLRAEAIVTLLPGVDPAAPAAKIVPVIDTSFRVAIVVWFCTAVWQTVRAILRWREE